MLREKTLSEPMEIQITLIVYGSALYHPDGDIYDTEWSIDDSDPMYDWDKHKLPKKLQKDIEDRLLEELADVEYDDPEDEIVEYYGDRDFKEVEK